MGEGDRPWQSTTPDDREHYKTGLGEGEEAHANMRLHAGRAQLMTAPGPSWHSKPPYGGLHEEGANQLVAFTVACAWL